MSTSAVAPPLAAGTSRPERLPLSLSQQRLWVVQRLDPGSGAYNTSRAFRVTGTLDGEVLEACIQAIVNRHEALHTVFPAIDGQPVQRLLDDLEVRLAEEDLGHLPRAEREAAARARAAEDARRPFDLARGPLLRAKLFHLEANLAVLALSLHHMVFDAWSMQIFMDELAALYDGFCRDALPNLPHLAVQYPDFALWQQARWHDPALVAGEVAYWRGRLAGTPPLLQLPLDHPRPAVQDFRGGLVQFDLGGDAYARLRGLAQRCQATPFMAALALFYAWLRRYSGQTDLVVGTPIANRNRRELEGLIGFFVNTLALRLSLEDDPDSVTLVARVRAVCIEAYAHQELPFERLVEALQPARTLAYPPLVQVTFSLLRQPPPRALGPATLAPLVIDSGTAKFDLGLSLWHDGDALSGRFEYAGALFERSTVERMARQFTLLLDNALADPACPLSRLRVLDDAERRRLLLAWNDTATPYPRDAGIHELFDRQARRTPAATAVEFAGVSLTYAQLRARSVKLCSVLRRIGIAPGERVALCLEPSAALIAAMLAVLRAGAAYVPLDPSHPAQRSAAMVRDAGVRAIVTAKALAATLAPLQLPLVYVDAPRAAPGGDRAATTAQGRPKGVAVPHRAISRLVLNTDYIAIRPGERIAQAANVVFDAATFEIWGALLNGACVVGLEREVLLTPALLETELRRRRIDVLFVTTALFNQIARVRPGALGVPRCLLFGGEAVDPEAVRALLRDGRPAELLHVYGPTESTTFATCQPIREVAADATTVPIGRPIANTTAYVLDEHRQPVPPGVTGELYLGGDGLALGYHGDPAQSAQRFVTSDWAEAPATRLYRTGDLARLRPDGAIEYVARGDAQVKIRGFRVEPAEIEACLRAYPGVRQALVMALPEGGGTRGVDQRLAAYIVANKRRPPQPLALRDHLRERLPDYMVPASYIILDALPLTPNGKVNRDALPRPAASHPEASGLTPPRTDHERRIAALWAEVLGIETIGRDDDFFDLGGHSLLAVRLLAGIERVFGRQVPLAALFARPTVAALAECLGQPGPEAGPASCLLALQPLGQRPPFFCVPGNGTGMAMKALAQRLAPERPFYTLRPLGIEDGREPQRRVEDMAECYIAALRTVQPSGPYFLGGHCFGGLVAFEMAQRLTASGDEVRFLGVFDMLLPPAPGKQPALRSADARVSAVAAGVPESMLRVFAAQEEARDHYVARHYPGKLTLFYNRQVGGWARSRWQQLAAAVAYRTVPGDHFTMFQEPHVAALAVALRHCLEAAAPS